MNGTGAPILVSGIQRSEFVYSNYKSSPDCPISVRSHRAFPFFPLRANIRKCKSIKNVSIVQRVFLRVLCFSKKSSIRASFLCALAKLKILHAIK